MPHIRQKRNDVENQSDKRREAMKEFMIRIIKRTCRSFWKDQAIHTNLLNKSVREEEE